MRQSDFTLTFPIFRNQREALSPSCNLWLHLLIFSKSSGGLAPIVQFLASSTKLSAWSSEALPPKVCRRGHSNKLFQGLVSLAKFLRPVKFCAAQESSIVEPVVTCPFRYTIKKAAFLRTQGFNPTHHPEELFYPTSLRLITPWKPPNRQNEPAAK